jgi:hypothetical protein
MANPNINIPQSPIVNLRTGYLTQEWLLWLMNPQVLTISIGTPITVEEGGTGITSGTSGGVLAFTATDEIESSGELGADEIVLGGGAGATPYSLGSLGTTTTVLHGNASGAPTFGPVVTGDVQDEAITYAKIQDVTDDRLLGRSAGTAGPPMEITVGAGLSLNAGVLEGAGGDVTGPASSGDGNVVLFDGLTGKIIKDGGTPVSFIQNTGYWSPLTNGDVTTPELIFALGDTISVFTPT